jgi:hypothetical protein
VDLAQQETGLVYPVWAMVAMAASVTMIFVNSLGGRPTLLFDAISSVGRQLDREPDRAAVPAARWAARPASPQEGDQRRRRRGIALVAVGLALTPGPNLLYLVSRSLAQRTRAGLISLPGIGAGFVIWLAAAVAGLAAVLAAVPAAYTAVRIAGAMYLLWLAWQNLRRRPAAFDAPSLGCDSPATAGQQGLLPVNPAT